VNKNTRLIARLDIKGPNLIKGVHLEGLRVIGSPNEHAIRYYLQGADELIYMDCVASLYGRNHLGDIVRAAARDIFVPMTVGGGIRSVDDATQVLRTGADKVAVNTAAVRDPDLVRRLADNFGSQCVVAAVDVRRQGEGEPRPPVRRSAGPPLDWNVYITGGREPTGLDAIEWIARLEALGAGEILLTSMDRDGTQQGYDLVLLRAASGRVGIPVIASGGAGNLEHLAQGLEAGAHGVLAASIFHFQGCSLPEARAFLRARGFPVRP